ncbi:hypothetical protein [Psychrobium sp. 1_MG-2023]|uniref:hypothetical protein n=1 Tax=Psychrobium sp. 1_MG-2023 TaxID=3062624 RepID=UPI000C34F84C|nr:hypothetical protein [Psychrobium sp. 1_MG-2023]MDP2562244.1 hypothetical protein [Psychrobium sp. 1_MG-2023]PKF57495.1 hypothetical protein CW748_06275 [Alteromonadales bacterium alter-6D02]
MGFFSKLFSKAEAKPQRELTHPSQLRQGDIIVLDDSFALPVQLRGQSLEVSEVNSYEYEHSKECEWVLRGTSDELLFLSVYKDDEESLILSRKITRETVGKIFDLDQFSQLFDEPGKAVLDVKSVPTDLEQWLGQHYRQDDFARFGYFHDCDHRDNNLSIKSGDSFERYSAISDDEKFAIEAEVYEGGETDVVVSLYRPISDIRQYWPKT